jgi:hypothetical protein
MRMPYPYPGSPHPTRGLQVWLFLRNPNTRKGQRRYVTRFFHPNGELTVLAPYWPLPSGTGSAAQTARYRGDDLGTLHRALTSALADLASRPERWKEPVLEPIHPEWEPRMCEVTRAALRERLLDLLEGVDLAIHRPGEIELEFQ